MVEKKKRERDPLDRYYSPIWLIDQCLELVVPTVTWRRPEFILEPSTGSGAFLGPLRRKYPNSHIYAIDVDPAVGPWPEASESYEGDFLETDWDEVLGRTTSDELDLQMVIGNPPYIHAIDFCQEALAICDTVIYILRVDFLCSAGRANFFREHPPSHVFLLPNRPPFYGPALRPPYTDEPKEGSTGEYDYAWICWSPMADGQETQLIWLPEVSAKIRRPR